LLNLKTYEQSTGQKALDFVRAAERVYAKTGVSIALAAQALDIQALVDASEIPVFSQHIDPVYPGRNTGHILPEAVAESGCYGTLLNHSEHQLPLDVIEKSILRAKIALFNPDVIAIEPSELIGSGISVSKAQPEVVSGSVKGVKSVNSNVIVLCGAGITNGEDASAALDLGARGILVASGVVKSEDPYKSLLDLARSMQR
jgi:triosephosphate isomerase